MSDSSDVDAALTAKLLGDTTLMGYLPDGVFFDEANPGATRFVLVSLLGESDEPGFGGRFFETATYLVKAVALSTSGANVKAAAARIDALLEGAALTIPGYTCLSVRRDERIRLTEVDDRDASIRWFHRGGHYEVMVAPD